jgi:hypothetical protein
VVATEKSVASTPLTGSLNVAVKLTLLADVLLAAGDVRLIDNTVGDTVSTDSNRRLSIGSVETNSLPRRR